MNALDALESALADAFDPELYGFPWYLSIADEEVRAVRSNQTIGLVDAAVAHLDALADGARQVRQLVGPNGRTMPTRAEEQERGEVETIRVEITDALRAAGSLLDVLGGLAALFLGLPINPTFADSRQLLRCEPEPQRPNDDQATAVEQLRSIVRSAASEGPAGWMEWTLETRNAMIHRGRSLTVWLPVPKKIDRDRLVVVTGMEPQWVVRQFPHMRRMPDLTDAESLLIGVQLEDAYLQEPAQDTLDGLAESCRALAASVAETLHGLLGVMDRFSWPETEWTLSRRSPRALEADRFRGFSSAAPPFDVTAIYVSPREGKRLLPMEKLRRRRGEG